MTCKFLTSIFSCLLLVCRKQWVCILISHSAMLLNPLSSSSTLKKFFLWIFYNCVYENKTFLVFFFFLIWMPFFLFLFFFFVGFSFIQRIYESYSLGNSLSVDLRELLGGSRGEALIYNLGLRNTCSQAYISVKGHC